MIIHDDDREYQDWAARLTDSLDRVPSGLTIGLWVGVLYLVLMGSW